jgi:NAD(P)H-dependent FMN reductase
VPPPVPLTLDKETRTTRIGIILGSTRPNRRGEQVAKWVYGVAARRGDAEFELVDLRDRPLPHLDEPMPPSMGGYQNDHAKQWATTIASFNGYVIVTPEYNRSTSGVLKNAIDYLFTEWHNKAIGFVSYGAVGGARAVEHLRLMAGVLKMTDVGQQVTLPLSHLRAAPRQRRCDRTGRPRPAAGRGSSRPRRLCRRRTRCTGRWVGGGVRVAVNGPLGSCGPTTHHWCLPRPLLRMAVQLACTVRSSWMRDRLLLATMPAAKVYPPKMCSRCSRFASVTPECAADQGVDAVGTDQHVRLDRLAGVVGHRQARVLQLLLDPAAQQLLHPGSTTARRTALCIESAVLLGLVRSGGTPRRHQRGMTYHLDEARVRGDTSPRRWG